VAGFGSTFATIPVDSAVVRIALAVALGLFLGLEREWSQKEAGIRTFALVSVLGTIFSIYDTTHCTETPASCLPLLTVLGGAFVTVLAGAMLARGLLDADDSLHLTTAVSLVVAYGIGVFVGAGEVLPATVVAVTSSLLLVFKRELHGFAGGLSREEVRSASEFAILAFVIYPLLPVGSVSVGSGELAVSLEPRVVWLMVVFVAGIGIVNYAIVSTYGGRGIVVTGFVGGLASSTAVVGAMLEHVRENEDATAYAVAAILLADAAMAVRNLAIALLFTFPGDTLFGTIVPLGVLVLASVVITVGTADFSTDVSMDLETPFELRNVLRFGLLFLLIVVVGGVAGTAFGQLGFYVTAAISGLVSSAGAATSAVVLYRSGQLSGNAAVFAIVLATVTSVLVKGGLASRSSNEEFGQRVMLWSSVLLVLTLASSGVLFGL